MKTLFGKRNFLFSFSIIILLGLCLYFIITSSFNVRYWADDFCSAATLTKLGFWGSQKFWWESWSGRYSFTALLTFFQMFGPTVARILPIVTYILLALSAVTVTRRFSKILPILVITLTLINAPNIVQSFYWQTGVLTYVFPFIFFNLFLGVIVWPQTKHALLIAPILTFVAGGFSESYALTQILAILILIVVSLVGRFKDNNKRLKVLLFGLGGAVLAMLVVAMAPGNAGRALSVTQPESMAFVITNTLLTAKWYLLRMFGISTFIYSLIVAVSAVLLYTTKPKITKKVSLIIMTISLLSIILLVMAVMFSGYYSMAYIPPERTLFIVFYMAFVCVISIAYFGSALFKHKPKNIIMVVGVIATLLLINSVALHWSDVISELEAYAQKWDRQEEIIISAKLKGEIPAISEVRPVGSLDGFVENEGWVASCAAGYYGVDEIELED